MEHFEALVDIPKQYYKDSVHLIRRCNKPDFKEYMKTCKAVSIGVLVMGTIGYTVKLVHIPINNIIVGGA